jgi:8-oxo-dGTP diphosphatase
MKFGTKSVIVKDGKILLIKRSSYDSYRAGEWDLPGGRLEKDEELFAGHKREVMEETGLAIDILRPIRMWTVDRPDGKHAGLTFASKYISGSVVLSNEHTEHKWVEPKEIHMMDAAAWIKEEVTRAAIMHPELFR